MSAPTFTRGPARRPSSSAPPTRSPRRLASDEDVFDEREPAPPPPPASVPPATPEEAEVRFWRRYGPALGLPAGAKPQTVEEWLTAATRLRDTLKAVEEIAEALGRLNQ